MPDRPSEDVTSLLERKRAWHRAQAKAPLQEKVHPPGIATSGSPTHSPPATSAAVGKAVGRDAVEPKHRSPGTYCTNAGVRTST